MILNNNSVLVVFYSNSVDNIYIFGVHLVKISNNFNILQFGLFIAINFEGIGCSNKAKMCFALVMPQIKLYFSDSYHYKTEYDNDCKLTCTVFILKKLD